MPIWLEAVLAGATIGNIIVGFFIYAIAVGRWAGTVESRRTRGRALRMWEDGSGNGVMTQGELSRRVVDLQSQVERCVRADTFAAAVHGDEQEHASIWAAIRGLERRIGGMEQV